VTPYLPHHFQGVYCRMKVPQQWPQIGEGTTELGWKMGKCLLRRKLTVAWIGDWERGAEVERLGAEVPPGRRTTLTAENNNRHTGGKKRNYYYRVWANKQTANRGKLIMDLHFGGRLETELKRNFHLLESYSNRKSIKKQTPAKCQTVLGEKRMGCAKVARESWQTWKV